MEAVGIKSGFALFDAVVSNISYLLVIFFSPEAHNALHTPDVMYEGAS